MQDTNLDRIDNRYSYIGTEEQLTQAGAAPVDRAWFDKEQQDDRQAAAANLNKGNNT